MLGWERTIYSLSVKDSSRFELFCFISKFLQGKHQPFSQFIYTYIQTQPTTFLNKYKIIFWFSHFHEFVLGCTYWLHIKWKYAVSAMAVLY